jgi:methionyl aminopeptidase
MTNELNNYAYELHREMMAIPAPLGFGKLQFPKNICAVNDVICHGIPDDVSLKEGDIVNMNVYLNYQGYFGHYLTIWLTPNSWLAKTTSEQALSL